MTGNAASSRAVTNRIDARFAALRAAGRTGLIPFVTAGDPDPQATVAILHALVAAGADVVELGVPFSDPMADGPVIQRSSERALGRGVGLRRVLEYVAEFRRTDVDTPVVLMGYLNPVEMFGAERFAQAAREAGVDGVLLVDCPPEESAALGSSLDGAGLRQIFLAAPTSQGARLESLARRARGYIYYVSFAGVTGADRIELGDIEPRVAALRKLSAAPVAVGFGVKEPAQASAIAAFADAVVVGSALVQRLHDAADPVAEARAFLAPLRAALDAVQLGSKRTSV